MKNYFTFINEQVKQKKPTRQDLKIGALVETMGEFDGLDLTRQLGKVIEFKEYGYILIEFLSNFSTRLHSGHLNIGKPKHCFYVSLDKIINIIPDELAQKIIANEVLPYKASSELLRIFRRMKFDPKIEYLDISYLNIDKNTDDLITYMPAKKFTGDPEAQKGRQSMGVGKMLRKLEPKLEPKQVEDFVVKYKEAYNFIIKGGGKNIDVVTGEDIRYWYSNAHYAPKPYGSSELWNSCMSAPSTGKVLNLYCENPNSIALCIYTDDNDHLLARAIVWKVDDGRVYMDRIYANTAEQKQALLNFAKENGMVAYNNNEVRDTMEVTLPKDYGYKHRPPNGNPYMDTFRSACVGKDGRYFLANRVPANVKDYRGVYG